MHNYIRDFKRAKDCEQIVHCRPTQIVQVLVNLLNNSFDAIVHQSDPWVSIKVVQEKNKVLIYITDSGPGIAEEVAKHMMEPFYTTKEMGKGTGLGLSISKNLIELNHGQLVYNKNSSHTEFIVEMSLGELAN